MLRVERALPDPPFATHQKLMDEDEFMSISSNLTANVAAVQRFWQGFNTYDLDRWDEVCAPGFVNHHPGLPTPDTDLVTLKQTIAQLLFGAFPDLQSIEQDLIVDGDKVVTRRILRGTHQG